MTIGWVRNRRSRRGTRLSQKSGHFLLLKAATSDTPRLFRSRRWQLIELDGHRRKLLDAISALSG
jgi:hypothetical protein